MVMGLALIGIEPLCNYGIQYSCFKPLCNYGIFLYIQNSELQGLVNPDLCLTQQEELPKTLGQTQQAISNNFKEQKQEKQENWVLYINS